MFNYSESGRATICLKVLLFHYSPFLWIVCSVASIVRIPLLENSNINVLIPLNISHFFHPPQFFLLVRWRIYLILVHHYIISIQFLSLWSSTAFPGWFFAGCKILELFVCFSLASSFDRLIFPRNGNFFISTNCLNLFFLFFCRGQHYDKYDDIGKFIATIIFIDYL